MNLGAELNVQKKKVIHVHVCTDILYTQLHIHVQGSILSGNMNLLVASDAGNGFFHCSCAMPLQSLVGKALFCTTKV